jgi:MFS transporter, CP family, cyanate transporter
MKEPAADPPMTAGLVPTALALFVVSLGLRPQLVAIGPLIPQIQVDLGISHAVAGLLATIPVLCMGVFALVGPWFGRLLGPERAIAAGVGALAVFGLARAFAPEVVSVLVLTFGVGIGVAVVGPLMPMVVRQRVPGRAALATGAYAGGIVLGASLAAGLAVPLAGPDLDWRLPLAVFAAATGGSLIVWLLLERRGGAPATARTDEPPPRLPWRRRRAWALALIFAAQSVLFYAAVAWLPSIYVERGWQVVDAGFLLALMNAVGLLSTFGAPALAERIGSRREHLVVSAGASFAGLLGIAATPQLAVVWVVLLGLGLGAVFPLALTLPVDLAGRAREVGGLAAIMLFGGYSVSSVAPFLLGLVRDTTGSFDVSLWLMVGVAAVLLTASWFLVPRGLGRAKRSTRAASA